MAYGVGKSARFDTSLYGDGPANDMARAFAHKCQYFFDMWESKGDDRYEYTQDDLDSCVELPFLFRLGGCNAWSSVGSFWLRALRPKLVWACGASRQ